MNDLSSELAALRLDATKYFHAPVVAKTGAQRQKAYKDRQKKKRRENIAILDMETDPFDAASEDEIKPFCAVLYSEQFATIEIWEGNFNVFVDKLLTAIIELPDSFTIYAHNGGKFDFMFLVHRLRGEVSFKGRGIMRATIGAHELRDSYHIIPERLSTMQKSEFDYNKLRRATREQFRREILDYCISDCQNLLYFVNKFLDKFGFKLTAGAAALAKCREHYRPESVSPYIDEKVREFYIGGRVECLQGAGYWKEDLKLYDVNSMYPYAMANFRHPIGSEYVFRGGNPGANTAFLRLRCDNIGRALLGHDESGALTSNVRTGEFVCSKHEFEIAQTFGLIENVEVLECVDNFKFTDFKKFVDPLYDDRAKYKDHLSSLEKGSEEYKRTMADILFLKLLLNSCYGKFAQNPRKFKEHYLTDPGERAPDYGDVPEFMGAEYWIWSRQTQKLKFLNVGTSASITGAARAVLMRAIHLAKNPIYCDTDSLICSELRGVPIDNLQLGAWKLETEISELIVCGKKEYAYKTCGGKEKIVTKGASGLSWNDMLEILAGEMKISVNRAPTLTKRGEQSYIRRTIRRTAPLAIPDRLRA